MDEWLNLSKRNLRLDLGDVLFLPSEKRRHIDEETSGFLLDRSAVVRGRGGGRLQRCCRWFWVVLGCLPVGLGHMMTGVTGPWLSQLMAGLKAEEEDEVDG